MEELEESLESSRFWYSEHYHVPGIADLCMFDRHHLETSNINAAASVE